MSEEPLSLTKVSSSSNPQIVTIQSDNSPLPTKIILNETNYALWSQVMEMRIAAREIGDAVKKTFYDGLLGPWRILDTLRAIQTTLYS